VSEYGGLRLPICHCPLLPRNHSEASYGNITPDQVGSGGEPLAHVSEVPLGRPRSVSIPRLVCLSKAVQSSVSTRRDVNLLLVEVDTRQSQAISRGMSLTVTTDFSKT
jgi:hypothetical protein